MNSKIDTVNGVEPKKAALNVLNRKNRGVNCAKPEKKWR